MITSLRRVLRFVAQIFWSTYTSDLRRLCDAPAFFPSLFYIFIKFNSAVWFVRVQVHSSSNKDVMSKNNISEREQQTNKQTKKSRIAQPYEVAIRADN